MSVLSQRMPTEYEIGDTYAALLRRYPLWKIRGEEDYERASAVLADLFGREDLDADSGLYLDALLVLIADYEEEHYAIDTSGITPLDSLKHLLDANGMTEADLAAILDSQSMASEILSGKRKISVENAKKLGERFKVDFSLFL